MIRKIIASIEMIGAELIAASRSNLLPAVERTTESRQKNYGDARRSFDMIAPGKTMAEEDETGFDPNIKLLNYLDITRTSIPNEPIRLAGLPPSISVFLKAKTDYKDHQISPKITIANVMAT
ncbi:MAG TPA: hypothetical protein PKY50_07620 [Candidatus Competibacter sp.]|nr:hypothetical protein [Candidatus Competibacter sp.]